MSALNKATAVKAPANALPADSAKHITTFEYVCIMLARIGGMFGTTLTGTLATAFLHELYFGPAGVKAEEIAEILAVQTTLTTVLGIVIGFLSAMIVSYPIIFFFPWQGEIDICPSVEYNKLLF